MPYIQAAPEPAPARPRRRRVGAGSGWVALRPLPTPNLDPSVAGTYARGLAVLADAGVRIVDVDLSAEFDLANELGQIIALYELPFALKRYLAGSRPDVTFQSVRKRLSSPDVVAAWDAAAGGFVPENDNLDALCERGELTQRYLAELDRADVDGIILPTTPLEARPIGQDDMVIIRGRQVPRFATYSRYGAVAGVLGLPGISLPGGKAPSNLPIGLELDGRPGADELLFTVASTVEAHLRAAAG